MEADGTYGFDEYCDRVLKGLTNYARSKVTIHQLWLAYDSGLDISSATAKLEYC